MQSGRFSPANPGAARPVLPGESQTFHLSYRPGLDGVRGVAILVVVAAHAKMASGWVAGVGVNIFFVLSGFLITSLLLAEWERFHSISLKKFYARRALRLLPALLVLIAVVVTWHGVMSAPVVAVRTMVDGLIALFYSSNWMLVLGLRQPVHVFAHTWTLSIEEQFYLTWPILLILLLRRTGSRASLLRWVMLGMFLLIVERVVLVAGMPGGVYAWLNFGTDARADVLLTGCAAAIILHSKPICEDKRFKRTLKYLAWLVGIPGLMLINTRAEASVDFYAIGLHITTALFAVLVLVEVVISQKGVFGGLMSQRWLVAVGKVSYGLYLWHYPIFCEVQSRHWPPLYEVGVELVLTAFATVASYYLIERPALKWKGRFNPTKVDEEKCAKGSRPLADVK